MPPEETPRLYFSLSLFQPAVMTAESLSDAIQQLEDHLIDNASAATIVTHLLSIPFALGYALSGALYAPVDDPF